VATEALKIDFLPDCTNIGLCNAAGRGRIEFLMIMDRRNKKAAIRQIGFSGPPDSCSFSSFRDWSGSTKFCRSG